MRGRFQLIQNRSGSFRRSRSSAHDVSVEHARNIVYVHRFHEVAIEARAGSAKTVSSLSVPGRGNERRSLAVVGATIFASS
jgi:hypothetical protein